MPCSPKQLNKTSESLVSLGLKQILVYDIISQELCILCDLSSHENQDLLVNYCYVTNYPQIQQLETANIYYLSQFLWGRKQGAVQLLGSGSCLNPPSSCWKQLQSYQGLTGAREPSSKLTHVVVSKTQFLTGCCPEVSLPATCASSQVS